ncbi:hypothetical protein EHS25_005561 [Saitozyma podzolica]|uniref:Uncharacterized protein n=1 Tax=Saitozyma podzolica TaxID=1890683 RepID=A0A427XXZ7_9TREE|nr:hypothetical protein EHS25_005561 [Saitozyma podzolica]
MGRSGCGKAISTSEGKEGAKFSVLIVGEEATGHIWQSHTWPTVIAYPIIPPAATESFTSTMIPVSQLQREGFTPGAMGMVLCNDSNISQYVSMAFYLPTAGKLSVVILPAKFNSVDPLERLGIAVMIKPGFPVPLPTAAASGASDSIEGPGEREELEGSAPRKKKRRQSAPTKGSQPVTAKGSGRRRRRSIVPGWPPGGED